MNPMKKNSAIATVIIAIIGSLLLVGCKDGEVSEEEARKAGEILKRWQDQNK